VNRTTIALGLLLASGCAGAKPTSASAPTLTLGAVPLGTPEHRRSELAPLAAYLERKLSSPVQLAVAADYREFSRSLAERRFDLVLVGPVLYSRAHETGFEAAAVAERGGESVRRGVLFARADRGIAGPADLKGRKVAFVDPHSAAGFEYPFAFLYAHGVLPRDYQRDFVGSHEAVVSAVVEGRSDAGASYDGAITDLLPAEKQGALKIIGRTDPIPGEVFAVRLDAPRAQAIREALFTLDRDPEGRKVLDSLHADKLVAPAEGMFDGARAIDLLVTEQAGL
jgi:phosphonate transport system substrate-binding protein